MMTVYDPQLPVLTKGVITHNKTILNQNGFKCNLLCFFSLLHASSSTNFYKVARAQEHHTAKNYIISVDK